MVGKVALQASMEQFMKMAPGETYWAASDIGWATSLRVSRQAESGCRAPKHFVALAHSRNLR